MSGTCKRVCPTPGYPAAISNVRNDIGLSDEMQGALGQALADFARDLPERTLGLVVVTHSRHVVRPLLGLGPWCMRVGDDRRPTAEWAASMPVPAPAEAFLDLANASTLRMRAVKAVLDARRAKG
jgi:hypothetical protein